MLKVSLNFDLYSFDKYIVKCKIINSNFYEFRIRFQLVINNINNGFNENRLDLSYVVHYPPLFLYI